MDEAFMDIKVPFVPEVQEYAETSIPSSELIGDRMVVGQGATGMYADRRGQWWGADDPNDAPYYVDAAGNLNLKAGQDGGGNIILSEEGGVPTLFIGFAD